MHDAEISVPESPDPRGARLTSFHDEVETSATFYPEQFAGFLWRLQPHIQEDFGSDQIHQVIRLLDSMQLGETGVHNQRVSFRGRRVSFRFTLHRYEAQGAHAVVVYLTTVCGLTRVFDEEVKVFYAQLSGQTEQAVEAHIQKIKTRTNIHLQES